MPLASPAPRSARRGFTPRLATVLLAVNLAVLLGPLGGIVLLRLYESALIRRTEAELIAQAAVVAATFRVEIERERAARAATGETLAPHGAPLPAGAGVAPRPDEERFHPVEASLDLAVDKVLAPPPEPLPPATPPDPVAAAAGARLVSILRDAQATTLAGIRVVDQHGTVVASSRGELGLSLAARDEVRRALAGAHAHVLRERVSDEPPPPLDSLSRGTRLRVHVAHPVVADARVWGAVVVSRTPMGVGQSLHGIRGYLAAGALALVALVVGLAALTSWTIRRPVQALIARTELLAAGSKEALEPIARPGTLELRRLSEAFARTASVLDQREDYIRAFAASVAHEFKTPLASIRGTVEILRDHLAEMTAGERERFLGNLEKDAERLDRLVRELLRLARADVSRPGEETTAVAEVAAALAERFRAGGLEVALAVDREAGRVRMAREALESVLSNLLDNARQHGGAGARVEVAAVRRTGSSRAGGAEVEVVVADDGPGISEANLPRVFDRFFTTAREQGGTGLGLAIVRSLVEAHGGKVGVASRPGATAFRVVLPG